MLAKVWSSAVLGVDAYLVAVEVDIALGLPTFNTVGLPDLAVKESRDRVKAAIKNSGFEFPAKRITVNLAPADIKKEGAAFDLPTAVGILAAQELIRPERLSRVAVLGELSLDGAVRPVKGALCMAVAAKEAGLDGILVPAENAAEAAVVEGLPVYGVQSLLHAMALLNGEQPALPTRVDLETVFAQSTDYTVDFSDVRGQEHAKRALEVAAAGGHNILLIGPPGSGKTMLARRLPTILPNLSLDEAISTTKVHSICGLLPPRQALLATRPFRAPHHTISDAGLIGGGAYPRPGEVSLAHNGVLFLDELPEFKKNVLEMLRQPLEDGQVCISRAATSLTYPANFMLVAAMNPCHCGFLGDSLRECICTPPMLQRYRSRLSGPLLDRIDLHVEVPRVPHKDLADPVDGESSAAIRARVEAARQLQRERLETFGLHANSQMQARHIRKFCPVDEAGHKLLEMVTDRLGLSARSYSRILKVARTIADLASSERIEQAHLAEAIQYRGLDRKSA